MIKEINCLFCNKNIVSETGYGFHFYCNDCKCGLAFYSSDAKSLNIKFHYYDGCFISQKELLIQNQQLNCFYVSISYEPQFNSQDIHFYKSKCDIDDSRDTFAFFIGVTPFHSMKINTNDITLDCLKRTIIKVIKNHSYL